MSNLRMNDLTACLSFKVQDRCKLLCFDETRSTTSEPHSIYGAILYKRSHALLMLISYSPDNWGTLYRQNT